MTQLQDAVICEPVRTPIGRFGGAFATVAPLELATTVIAEVIRRTGVDGAAVGDVIFGQGYPSAEAQPIGRVAALDAGLPVTVGGLQLDRRCGSGLQAVLDAAMQVQTGVGDVLIAGGVDSMSQAPLYTVSSRWGLRGTGGVLLHDALGRARQTAGGRYHPVPGGMLETAENLRRRFGISRAEQDELALVSHRRAVAAAAEGRFDDELVPVTVHARKGDVVVSADETPRSDTSLEALSRLTPVRADLDPEATVTAGNASGQNDAAAACLVTSARCAEEWGLHPIVRLVSWARAGVDPAMMGLGPVEASALALRRAELTMADIDLIELNEAFAAQVLAVTRSWNFAPADWERLNVSGSGISLGHPVGATGARILATGARELARRGGRYLLETMCIGGGQGIAAVFEAV